MARGGGSSGSGPMIFLFLICLCLSLSTGAGAYFYTKEDEDAEKDLTVTDDEFKAKYQEAMAALEVEKATQQNVEVAKTAVQLAQEKLEIARLAFESGEFANDGEKEAARTRVFSAESDAEAALSNLAAAETDSERASVNRQKAEDNAESALDVAITEGETLLTKASDTAAAKLITAEGNLAVARTKALQAIETAQGEADAAQITAAQAQKKIRDDATALLDAATTAAETSRIKREQAAAERTAQIALETELAAIEERKVVAQAALDKAIADVAAADAAAAAALAAQSIGYQHGIGSGTSISMDTSSPWVGGAFNDQLSAIKVGTGKWVRIFNHDQYVGANRTFFAGNTGVDPMNDEMTSFEAGIGTHPADTLVNGNAVKCLTNDVGKGQGSAVYRSDGQTRVLRHYPNSGIAGSWDSNWNRKFIEIDCQGFSLGADMPHNGTAPSPSPSRSSNRPGGQ